MTQLKQNSQSDNKLWFQKSNYPGEWLSEKSKQIINQIKKINNI
jgi:hypothetical protein